jgi:hypothetical protein
MAAHLCADRDLREREDDERDDGPRERRAARERGR